MNHSGKEKYKIQMSIFIIKFFRLSNYYKVFSVLALRFCSYLSLTCNTWANDHTLSSVGQLLSKQIGSLIFCFALSSGQRARYFRIAQKFLVYQSLGAFLWVHSLWDPSFLGRAVL